MNCEMINSSNMRFSKLFTDNKSGSLELLVELHEHLKNEKKILQIFPELIDFAAKQFRSFQNIQVYLAEMKSALRKEKKLEVFFDKYDRYFKDSLKLLLLNAGKILKPYSSFITISNSKTVLEVLKHLRVSNPELNVIVCESRPMLEGRLLAKSLIASKIKVRLITESMIYQFIDKVDAAITGADAILGNGDVINKSGSSLLGFGCKQFNKPFYVVADRKKFTKSKRYSAKKMPPEEIWRQYPEKIKIENYYFERIEKKLITEIISD